MNDFVIVHGWMARELGLKGFELYVFALIYGYTKSCGSYTGTMEHACDLLGISGNGWRAAVARLEKRKYVERVTIPTTHGKRYEYRASRQMFKFEQLSERTAMTEKSAENEPQMFKSEPFKCSDLNPQMFRFEPNSIVNNINNAQDSAPAREEWKDAGMAARMAEALRNGGTLRDDMLRGLSYGGTAIQAERLIAMADQFTALQRAAASDHTGDADYRSHFLRWATIQLKEEQAKRPKASPSDIQERQRREEQQRQMQQHWEERERGAISYEDYLAMKAKGQV